MTDTPDPTASPDPDAPLALPDPRDTMRWIWRGTALAALLIGWLFIAWQNHFHITAPLVFICLGYLAVVATVYNLWRTGAAAVGGADEAGDSTWAKPIGVLGELEREKRTLLKAIKEAEFDHEMGKLSKRDVDDMIRSYRARAIEVIKEIDRLGLGAAGTVREQILREVRARLELEARSNKKPGAESKPGARPAVSDAKAKKARDAAAARPPAKVNGSGPAPEASDAPVASQAGVAGDANHRASGDDAGAPAPTAAQAAEQAALEDEALNADSTTTVEPPRDEPAKEATP